MRLQLTRKPASLLAIMPFTLAHPAAVMPLRRLKWLQPMALIVGSMIPALPYFLPSRILRLFQVWDTHSFEGSFVWDIPLGLLVLGAILVLRYPLTALLTDRARWVSLRVAQKFTARPFNWVLAIPSLLVGSWTHILWDSFTHTRGWVVQRVSALSAPVSLFGFYTGEVCHILQYASSVFGLIVLAYWYRQVAAEAPKNVSTSEVPLPARLLLLTVVIVAACVVGSVQAYHTRFRYPTIYGWAYLVLTRSLAWFGLLYVIGGALTSIVERMRRPRRSDQEPEHA